MWSQAHIKIGCNRKKGEPSVIHLGRYVTVCCVMAWRCTALLHFALLFHRTSALHIQCERWSLNEWLNAHWAYYNTHKDSECFTDRELFSQHFILILQRRNRNLNFKTLFGHQRSDFVEYLVFCRLRTNFIDLCCSCGYSTLLFVNKKKKMQSLIGKEVETHVNLVSRVMCT